MTEWSRSPEADTEAERQGGVDSDLASTPEEPEQSNRRGKLR